MSAFWYIEDEDQITIYITNLWQEFYIPKFRILRVNGSIPYEEPYVYITWNDREGGTGGDVRQLAIDYRDVVDGYSGYVDNPSSAAQLAETIEAMIVSGFTTTDDILTAKADLLSHDGLSDTILPGGSNGFILQRDDGETTGLKWVDPSTISSSVGFNDFLLMGS